MKRHSAQARTVWGRCGWRRTDTRGTRCRMTDVRSSPKPDVENVVIAPLLLWFFLGLFTCAHRYYLGRWRSALIHNVFMLSGPIIPLIGVYAAHLEIDHAIMLGAAFWIAGGVWWLIDGPLTIAMAQSRYKPDISARPS